MSTPNPPRTGQTQAAQGENKTNSTTTYVIGCKLPHGMLMELGAIASGNHKHFLLKGLNSAVILGGFGVTRGVPADFFDRWAAQKKDFEFMRQGLIFKVSDEKDFEPMAKELKGQKTGLEPLSQSKLPKKVEKADRDSE